MSVLLLSGRIAISLSVLSSGAARYNCNKLLLLTGPCFKADLVCHPRGFFLRKTASTMSEKHVATGEPLPALKDGSLHLYSMKFCPFAQRPRLVLRAKGIEYQEINCNLKNKPEFLLELNPEGKVPVLQLGDKVVNESNIIDDLLDDLYPDPPLYPKDPYKKAQDKMVMEKFSYKVIGPFYKAFRSDDEEEIKTVRDNLAVFEAELVKRGTPYFGGERPSMVDYNIWPFMERIILFTDRYGNFIQSKLPILHSYVEQMLARPEVAGILNSKDAYTAFYAGYKTGNPVYDP